MFAEKNKEIIKHYYSIFMKGGDVPFEEFFSPEFVDHNGYPNQAIGPAGVREGYEMWKKSFRVQKSEMADIIAEDDKVVVRTMVTGTQTGEYFGKSATGKLVEIEGISIFRLSGGKILERWGSTIMKERVK